MARPEHVPGSRKVRQSLRIARSDVACAYVGPTTEARAAAHRPAVGAETCSTGSNLAFSTLSTPLVGVFNCTASDDNPGRGRSNAQNRHSMPSRQRRAKVMFTIRRSSTRERTSHAPSLVKSMCAVHMRADRSPLPRWAFIQATKGRW
jgi:hypothetical protein